jgi:hypothetical protein
LDQLKSRATTYPRLPLESSRIAYAALAIASCASRILYYLAGVRFDAEPLDFYIQFIDPPLLRHDLWRSLFYLKEQPPAFNLFLGLVLKLFQSHSTAAFHAIYLCLGFVLALSLFALLERMQVSRPIAFVITLVFSLNPITVLYENWLFYEYPLTVLFCVAALFLHRYASSGRAFDGSVFFWCLAIIGGIRSVYHLLWFVLMAVFVGFSFRRWTQRTILVALIPGVLLLSLYVKNFVLFRTVMPGTETFGAANLAKLATKMLPKNTVPDLIAAGKISPSILIANLPEMDVDVIERMVPVPPATGIPILDQQFTAMDGLNWNSLWLSDVAKLYRKDAMTVLRLYPMGYVRSVLQNLDRILMPATDGFPFDARETDNLLLLAKPLNVYILLTTGETSTGTKPGHYTPRYGWMKYFVLPGLLGFGLWRLIRAMTGTAEKRWPLDKPTCTTLLFIVFQIVYLSAVVVLLSESDQNRYREEVSAFFPVLLGMLVTACWGAFRDSRSSQARAQAAAR